MPSQYLPDLPSASFIDLKVLPFSFKRSSQVKLKRSETLKATLIPTTKNA